jgi:hypothetical protein
MAMTQAQFDALVAALEREAERHPRAYRLKLGAFATLGYVYVFGVLVALLGVVAALGVAVATGKGAILIKLAIPVLQARERACQSGAREPDRKRRPRRGGHPFHLAERRSEDVPEGLQESRALASRLARA